MIEYKKRLYKYCTINNNTKSALKEGKIWISDPDTFNDPFEFSLTPDMNYSEDLKRAVYTRSEQAILNKQNIPKVGVICYSYDCDNILMWSHYANNHKGICLGFEPNLKYNQHNAFDFGQLSVVKYSDYLPNPDLEDLSYNNIQDIFCTKATDWAYEKEVRQIFDKKSEYVDYPGILKDVYFGCKTSEADIMEIKELLKDKDVQFYYCEKQEGQYSLMTRTEIKV